MQKDVQAVYYAVGNTGAVKRFAKPFRHVEDSFHSALEKGVGQHSKFSTRLAGI